jgi:hypothetical protein
MNLFFLYGGLTVRRPSWRHLGGCHRGKLGLVRTGAERSPAGKGNGLTASIRGQRLLRLGFELRPVENGTKQWYIRLTEMAQNILILLDFWPGAQNPPSPPLK